MTRPTLLVLLFTLAGGCVAGPSPATAPDASRDASTARDASADGATFDGGVLGAAQSGLHTAAIGEATNGASHDVGTDGSSLAHSAMPRPSVPALATAAIPTPAPAPSPTAARSPTTAATPRPSNATSSTASPTAPASHHAIVVWTNDEEHGARSYFVTRNGAGHLRIRERKGIVIAYGGTLWRWVVRTRHVPLYLDCETDSTMRRVGSGTSARGELVRMGAPGRQRVVRLAPNAREEAQFDASVTLIGSVGPYLFVRDTDSEYSCGAHGNVDDYFRTWDAGRGRRVAVYTQSELGTLDRTMLPRARRSLLADYPDDLLPSSDDGSLRDRDMKRTVIAPVFGPDGRLSMEHQITADADYAGSDGAWTSYTDSTLVRTGVVPAKLTPLMARVTPLLAAFTRTHPHVKVEGVGIAPPALRHVFEGDAAPGAAQTHRRPR